MTEDRLRWNLESVPCTTGLPSYQAQDVSILDCASLIDESIMALKYLTLPDYLSRAIELSPSPRHCFNFG